MAWFVASILLLFSQNSFSKPSCSAKGQFIQPERFPKSEHALLKKNIEEAVSQKKLDMYGNESSLDFLLEGAVWLDINNDGVKEAVLTSSGGSSANLTFYIFHKKDNTYHYISTPENLEVEKGITRKSSHGLYAKVCDKTYVVRGYLDNWESVIWNGSKATLACNPEWLHFIRYLIPKILKNDDYDLALETAKNTYESCKDLMNDNERLWFLSDMSYIAYKLGDFSLCKSYLNKGKNNNAFAKASPRVKKALNTNNSLCSREQLSLVKDGFLKVCEASQKSKHLVNKADQLIVQMIQETQYECGFEMLSVCNWTKEISCHERAQQIAKTKRLKISSCRIADLDNLDFLEGFDGIEKLIIISDTSAGCLYRGACDITNWNPIEKIKIKELEIKGDVSDHESLINFIKQQKSLERLQLYGKFYNRAEMANLSIR